LDELISPGGLSLVRISSISCKLWSSLRAAHLFSLLLLLAAVITLPGAAHAQTTGALSGTVRDSTGGLIPGAQVLVVNTESKARRTTTSNSAGTFTLNALQPATYNVTITAPGFQALKITGVEINPGDNRNIEKAVLKVGQVDMEVTVTATVAGVSLDSPEKSSLITADDIKRLSTVGRDATELIKTLPGFAVSTGGGLQNSSTANNAQTMGFTSSSVSSFSANGGTPQTGATTVISDGASVMDPGDMGASISNVNMDMVQEVKVQTSNFGADSAKGPVVINAVGKSGGSEYHGSAYIFARNGSLNANDWLNNYNAVAAPPSSYYFPGANVGGPVRIPGTSFNRSKKMTFFAGVEIYRQNVFQQLLTSFIPTARMMQGDLTPASIGAALGVDPTVVAASCPAFYTNNNFGAASGYCYSPGLSTNSYTQQNYLIKAGVVQNGANAACDASQNILSGCLPIDKRALIYSKFWPAANRTPRAANGLASDGYNYVKAITATNNGYQFHGRVDENFTDATKLYVTYNLESVNSEEPIQDGYYAGSDIIPYPTAGFNHAHSNSVSLNFTHVFSPTLTNEFVPAGTLFFSPTQLSNRNLVQDSSTGWTGGRYYNNGANQLPGIIDYENGVPDFAFNYIPTGNGRYFRKFSYDVADNLTKQIRTHSVKAGVYAEETANNQIPYAASNGTNSFNHYNSACPIQVNGATQTNTSQLYNNVANFLQGCTGFSQTANSNSQDLYFRTLDFYATDEWKTTRKLTLTFGLRFDHLGPWFDPHGVGLAVWNAPAKYQAAPNITQDPHTYPGISWHQTNPSIPTSGQPGRVFFYSPRVGLAYDVFANGKTVVRGGWGAYRFHDSYNDSAGPLATVSGQQNYTVPTNISCTYDEITQAGYYTPANTRGGPCANSTTAPSPFTIYALNPKDSRQPVTYNYNLTIDQALNKIHSNLEVSYVGNQSHELFTEGNLNNQNYIPLGGLFQPDPITGAVTTPGSAQQIVQDYRPYPYYTQVYVPNHVGYGNYNAFQAALNKQKGALIYGVNYTWSKALGIRGDYRTGAVGDPSILRNNYGILGFNRTQALNFTYSYQVGDAYHGLRALQIVLNRWEVSGITSLQSGPDIAVLNGTSNTNFGLGGGVQYTPPGSSVATAINLSNSTILGTPDINLQPVVTCSPKSGLVSGSKYGTNYVNGHCFSLPTLGHNGAFNLPDVHGPSYFNTDLTVQRTIHLHEKQELQFRVAGFNFINHPLHSFYGGSAPVNLGLSFGLPTNFTATTPQQAIANAVENSVNFGYTPYKSGFRILEFGARYNF
jgi:hypothetical protein